MTSDMNESNCDVVDPRASNMIEALRDIGYSLESAVADIIDNSIFAEATQIDIRFGWEQEGVPWLAIIDDGHGMSDAELAEAMRLGGWGHERKAISVDSVLGLKKPLSFFSADGTVLSQVVVAQFCTSWDLDLRDRNKWLLRRLGSEEIASLTCSAMLGACGTLVLWQVLDRLDLGSDPTRLHQLMNERMASICEHVALVFHRFISGEPRQPKITISVNSSPIEPYDPFNARHAATMHLGDEVLDIEGKAVTFKPYILPHHSKVGHAEYERLGGREGYVRGQGFYIYRNRRLIIHGTWFRMARQDEMTKLARVQVDIPNTLDHLWTIDVRKSRAHPPEAVKRRLRAILERIRESAKRPYTHRGTLALAQPEELLWQRLYLNSRVRYQPNAKHPLLDEFRADLPPAMRSRFDGILEVIGRSLPYPMLFNDMASRPKETDRRDENREALGQLAALLFGDGQRADPEILEKLMRHTEPFASSPDFVADFVARLHGKGGAN